ncbi:MAG: oxaloacetate decarboxylase [Deltaproteobacteria bacterium GWA2_57_13]|nr:MAG: oxaloacetate decarboxylase [Deltaproteobacteria bacterium GWA2_57_13]
MGKKIELTETVLRDAHQSLLATRMRTEDMLPVAGRIDQVGYWSVEMWGGATFDAALRYLKESPWERLRQLRQAMPKTRMQMLLRGQNVVGYHNYPDDVVVRFVEKAAENGIDVFRVFDAMNDVRNMKTALEAVKKTGKILEAALCYTISPVHTVDYFVRLGERLVEMGTDVLCVKDMAGLLTPYVGYELIRRLKGRIKLPIHLHSHCTTGMAPMTYIMAVEAGVDIIDTAISAMSQGTSQPATEATVVALRGTPYDTGLSLRLLGEIAEHFRTVRARYADFDSPVSGQIHADIMESQIPGGMFSNLVSQLRQQKAEGKLEAVLNEVQAVRKDLGYPPLVTPTSQIVGSQATVNVMTGKRYSVIPTETRNYVMGLYGEPQGAIDEEVKKKVLGKKEPITCRPADLLKPGLEQARKEVGSLARSEEDVLTYALFPEVAKDYFLWRDGHGERQPAIG